MRTVSEFRFAVRQLFRHRSFSALAVGTLALGIGVNVAIFCFVNGLALKPLPFPDEDKIVLLNLRDLARGRERLAANFPDFRHWRQGTQTLEALGAYSGRILRIVDAEGRAHEIRGQAVAGDFFAALGVQPRLGRVLRPEGEPVAAVEQAVISDRLYREFFGSRPGIIGSEITLNGKPVTVIGVMKPDFRFPESDDIWVPVERAEWTESRTSRVLNVVGRIARNSTYNQSEADLQILTDRLATTYPEDEGLELSMERLREGMVPSDARLMLFVLCGVVLFVLLIACVNVTNLALARNSARRTELAVRAALGASRIRLLWLLLTEAIVVALAAGVCGAMLGSWGKNLILSSVPVEPPFWMDFDFDGLSGLYVVLISVTSAFLYGLVPALRLTGSGDAADLRRAGRLGSSRTGPGLGWTLVAAQVALTLILLAGAGLMMKSYLVETSLDIGFEPDGVLSARVVLLPTDYPQRHQRLDFFARLRSRMESLPGVVGVAGADWLPFQGFQREYLTPEGHFFDEPSERPLLFRQRVTPGFFETLKIGRIQGRTFSAADTASSPPVAVVNRAAGARFWPDQDPIGKRFRLGDDPAWIRVVGVVENIAYWIDEPPGPAVYVTFEQFPAIYQAIAVRIARDVELNQFPEQIRVQVGEMDRLLPVEIIPLATAAGRQRWQENIFGFIFAIFAALALMLSAVGLYGVLAYSVSMRRHEIGIRMALGARSWDVVRLMLRRVTAMVGLGTVAGLAGALVLTRYMATLLLNTSATDGQVFAIAPGLLVLVALGGGLLPTLRAARIEPADTLTRISHHFP